MFVSMALQASKRLIYFPYEVCHSKYNLLIVSDGYSWYFEGSSRSIKRPFETKCYQEVYNDLLGVDIVLEIHGNTVRLALTRR
jgi:hypothetical protein